MELLTDPRSWIAPTTLLAPGTVPGEAVPVRLHAPYAAKPEASRPVPSGNGA
jgi:hypothetical protein